MFCISKGLCAPVGSLVCGGKEFIAQARLRRKVMGGGMRQAGILAAAGIIGIQSVSTHLAEDHQKARALEEGLLAIPGIKLPYGRLDINMVYFKLNGPARFTDEDFVNCFAEHGIIVRPPDGEGIVRFVTHQQVNDADVEKILAACREIFTP
jgi:threonine aldolase